MTYESQNMNNWQQTMRTLSDSAIYLFNNKTISDVTFVFNNNNSASKSIQIHAHSWILSMLSPVFYESFKENFEVLKQIPVSEASYESFLECLRFVYTSKCILTKENAFEVMKVAQKYSLNFLEGDCADYIIKTVSVESVCPSLDNAITFEQNHLKDKLIEFIAPNIASVLKANSFPNIKKESLEAILSIEKTGIINEVEIFNCAMKWASQKCISTGLVVNGSNKRQNLGELVKKIRFSTMTPVELGQCIAQEEGLLTVEEGYSLLLSATTNRMNNLGFRDDPRQYLINLKKINAHEILLSSNINWGYQNFPLNYSNRSKFSVSKMIYLTGLYLAMSELTQNTSIQIFNDKNVILCEKTFEVIGNFGETLQLTNPLLLNPNQEYIVVVKFDNNNCRFHCADKEIVPYKKIQKGVRFNFSELSQLIRYFSFILLD